MIFVKKDLIIIIFLTITAAGALDFIFAEENLVSGKQIVGGQCVYKSYLGSAKIVSIKEIRQSSDAVNKKFEIRFSFQPNQDVDESFAKTEGKAFTLLDDNSVPDQAFVARHGISVDKVFPCVMKVIVRGTCTPMMFEFPTFDDTGR